MPFPSEHAARQLPPGNFDKFRRENDKGGAGVHFIFGIKDGKSSVQSVRFDKSKFTVAEAKAWLSKHKMKTGVIPATSSNHDEGATGSTPAGASAITVPVALKSTSVQYKYNEENDMDPDEEDLEMDSDELVEILIDHPEISLTALKEGMEHELEHTGDKEIALKIALDHLQEYPDYYQRLAAVFPKDHSESHSSEMGTKEKNHVEYKTKIDEEPDPEDPDEEDEDEDELGFSEDGKTLLVEAFKSGTHTDAGGNTQTWTPEDLDDIASKATSQIPVKPIPVCLGHPSDNSPAYGWVESLKRVGNKLVAKLTELNPSFVDALKSGSFKGRSISLYDDNRVRHLGFLGASQPAVEGLNPLKFSESKEEHYKLYEFSEEKVMANIDELQKKLSWYERLFSIFKKEVNFKEPEKEIQMDKTVQTADHHEAMTVVAKENGTEMAAATSGPAINADIVEKETKDSGVLDTSKVQAAEAKNDANDVAKENDDLKAKVQYLESQIKALQDKFGQEKQVDNVAFCESLVKEGKLRPADVEMTLLALNSMAEIDNVNKKNSFVENSPVQTPRLDSYKAKLSGMPKVIEFGEFPTLPAAQMPYTFPSGEDVTKSMTAMIEKKMAEKDKLGLTNKTSYWDMMKECMAECAKEYPKEYAEYAKSMLPQM
jgi:hypothetical protein